MSKLDYNFQLLLTTVLVILGITGICATAALMMFLFAFL